MVLPPNAFKVMPDSCDYGRLTPLNFIANLALVTNCSNAAATTTARTNQARCAATTATNYREARSELIDPVKRAVHDALT